MREIWNDVPRLTWNMVLWRGTSGTHLLMKVK